MITVALVPPKQNFLHTMIELFHCFFWTMVLERRSGGICINSSCLPTISELLGDKKAPGLETSLKHCKRLIKLMAESGVGASAFADVDSTLN